MADCTSISDYNASEIPMQLPEWRSNLYASHPMCDIKADFVKETLAMHNRTHEDLFVAFDGRGNIDEFIPLNATIIRGDNHSRVIESFKHETKFLEMFLCIHGDFFIMNPRSTFSFEVFVIRSALLLSTVPILKNHDFYVKNPRSISPSNPLWVTFSSIETAFGRSTIEASQLTRPRMRRT